MSPRGTTAIVALSPLSSHQCVDHRHENSEKNLMTRAFSDSIEAENALDCAPAHSFVYAAIGDRIPHRGRSRCVDGVIEAAVAAGVPTKAAISVCAGRERAAVI